MENTTKQFININWIVFTNECLDKLNYEWSCDGAKEAFIQYLEYMMFSQVGETPPITQDQLDFFDIKNEFRMMYKYIEGEWEDKCMEEFKKKYGLSI